MGKTSNIIEWVQNYLTQHPVDRVVGFNKMPGPDVYYAADVCYARRLPAKKAFSTN